MALSVSRKGASVVHVAPRWMVTEAWASLGSSMERSSEARWLKSAGGR